VSVAFVKGHGTENDFVVLPDFDDRFELTQGFVQAICDRHAGLGADGVLRVVRNPEGSVAPWFMDYRNADGSIAEMCGNGIRVFARYLVTTGLAAAGVLSIETRSGVREVRAGATGDITVDLGRFELPDLGLVKITIGPRSIPAIAVRMPNPHLVAFVDHLDDAGDLHEAPGIEPETAAPDGANVELVVRRGPRHIAMRVFERGVGETRSCGTGAAAAAIASAYDVGDLPAHGPVDVRVDVPGGTLVVTVHPACTADLKGPAVLVAEGSFQAEGLAGYTGSSSPALSLARASAPVSPA
jgi:diaminopimelate epimerase